MKYIILFLFIIYWNFLDGLHLHFRFGNRINIKEREYKKQIVYTIPSDKQKIVNKINGFYGLIGPDINVSSVNNLFDLFVGDGNIQGVFFDKGNITLIRHFVRTEKLKYEERYGQIPHNNFIKFIFILLNKIRLLPNIMGLANTALFNVRNKIYALYERDLPYLLNVNFTKKEVTTTQKMEIHHVNHISGHSKFINNSIETIDYDVLQNHLIYYKLSSEWKSFFKFIIKTKYMPVIHDFWSGEHKVIFVDSPLMLDYKNIFKKHLPFLMNHNPTFIHVLNKQNQHIEKYQCAKSFYIFHYGDVIETPTKIHIYASLYEKLDFSELNIRGIYHEIVIDKHTKRVYLTKNPDFDKYNLDFPIRFENKIVFRNVYNRTINGFVVVEKMKLVKELLFDDMCIHGEPALFHVDKIPYLIAFAELDKKGCILFINLHDYTHFHIDVPFHFSLGFHSLFIPGSP
jgi:hypothetical protein